MARESDFQRKLKKRLKKLFPGCIIIKGNSGYLQGIPDLLILYYDQWAMLEVKDEKDADHQPNQDYYIEKLNGMSYAAFVYPENEEEVIHDLQQTFRLHRSSRISLRKQG